MEVFLKWLRCAFYLPWSDEYLLTLNLNPELGGEVTDDV